MKKQTTKGVAKSEKKIEAAMLDFEKLMAQVQPFVKKSEITFNSTEGKWFDTATISEEDLISNTFEYR